MPAELLKVEGLTKHFPVRGRGLVRAVDGIDFAVAPGETLGLVGESGRGKTTLSRTVMRLLDPTAGKLSFRGTDITDAGRRDLRPLRRDMQMVFQDPFASLNPRRRVADLVGDVLAVHGERDRARRRAERRAKEAPTAQLVILLDGHAPPLRPQGG
jgi:peptide/nickel transport system ATP-binding protein